MIEFWTVLSELWTLLVLLPLVPINLFAVLACKSVYYFQLQLRLFPPSILDRSVHCSFRGLEYLRRFF